MVGMSDAVGTLVMCYVDQHGRQAGASMRDDESRAIGRSDWDAVHQLQRAKLRLLRMQMAGYFDSGKVAPRSFG